MAISSHKNPNTRIVIRTREIYEQFFSGNALRMPNDLFTSTKTNRLSNNGSELLKVLENLICNLQLKSNLRINHNHIVHTLATYGLGGGILRALDSNSMPYSDYKEGEKEVMKISQVQARFTPIIDIFISLDYNGLDVNNTGLELVWSSENPTDLTKLKELEQGEIERVINVFKDYAESFVKI